MSESTSYTPARPRKRRIPRSVLQENATAYLCISPWIIGFLAFQIGPILAAVYFSLTKYSIIESPKFIGLMNYVDMFTRDPLYWQSLKVTAIYSAGSVILGIIGGVAVALLLNQNVRGIAVYRTCYYLPAVYVPQARNVNRSLVF